MKAGKYSIELKKQVLCEYKKGETGYKRLARKYGLYRDLVRSWVLNASLWEKVKLMTKRS